jgi:hypothetical protein
MNYLPSNEKLISISAKEANVLRNGLIKVANQGIWGGDTARPLHPQDLKHEEEFKKLAHEMIDKLEEILYAFEYESRNE